MSRIVYRPAPSSNRIAEVLFDQGRSKVWLARQIGVNRITVHDWIKGEPSKSRREQIARTLDVPVESVFPLHAVSEE